MNLYLSSFTIEALTEYNLLFPDEKLNVLLSYAYRNGNYYHFLNTHRDKINSLILDSGTYTKNKSTNIGLTESIRFEGYKAYLKSFDCAYDYYFNYDRNFSPEGVFENLYYQTRLQDCGHFPVPVVHDYNRSELYFYLYNERYSSETIALGFAKDKLKNIERLSWEIYDCGKKVHVLGVSSYNKLKETPIAYTDSSSWMQYSNYGQIRFWNENKRFRGNKLSSDPDFTDTINFLDGYTKAESKKTISNDIIILPITERRNLRHTSMICLDGSGMNYSLQII